MIYRMASFQWQFIGIKKKEKNEYMCKGCTYVCGLACFDREQLKTAPNQATG
ncbi:MAG: hypothetical protein ACNS62_15080 [Candidatus Cyclobacteriaceae bacterium M3_2C_046]